MKDEGRLPGLPDDLRGRAPVATSGAAAGDSPLVAACLDALPYYVMLVDAEHRIVMANRATRAAFGLDPSTITGAYCPRVVHGRETPFPGCPLEAALAAGHGVETEMFDDRLGLWLASAVYPTALTTDAGIPIYLHTVRDITARKRAADEVARSAEVNALLADVLRLGAGDAPLAELLAHLLARLLAIPWLSVESRGAILLMNTDGNALEMMAQQGIAPALLERCRRVPLGVCLCGRAAASGELEFCDGVDARHENSYAGMAEHGHYCVPVRAAGEVLGVITLYLRPGHRRDPGEESFLAMVADALALVVRRRRAEERYRAGEERFRTVVASIGDTVMTADREQRFTGVFGQLAATHPEVAGALVGLTMREALGPEEADAHEAAHARALAGERVVYEWQLDEHGERLTFQTAVAPHRDQTGEVVGVVRVSRDVTQQRQLEARLATSDRMASMGTLAAGVAHEINNPLAVVVASLDFALGALAAPGGPDAGGAAADELADALRDAREAAAHVRHIVRDLKIFSRPDEERLVPVDVRAVVESSLRMAWNEIRHRARVVKLYEEVPAVLANEARLGQVLINLLVNAAQAIPEGRANDNAITVRTFRHGAGHVGIEVRDTGGGIPPAVRARMFEPFFTTKPIGRGTGLGLSICRRLIHDIGGEIAVESEVGKGSAFRVYLPAGAGAPARGAAAAVAGGARRARVLVVDDDPAVGKAVARTLGAEHDVTAVTEGATALARLTSGERFDLVVCDLMMPTMTGVELHAALERVAPEAARRMVFLTGGAFTDTARQFLDRVPNQRLDKPFDGEELRALVRTLVG